VDNFNKLHQEQDDFIKKTLQQDKVVNQPILDNFATYIEHSNIKVKKKSSPLKYFILLPILIIILLCIFLVNKNLFIKPADNLESLSSSNTTSTKNTLINTTNKTSNNSIKNEVKNTLVNTTNSISNNVIVADLTPTKNNSYNSQEFDLEELKTLIESYSVGIQRLTDKETLEGNTILLFIAKEYFDSNSSKTSLKVDTKYAATLDNMHTYLTELTGKDYSNIDVIPSYNNYIGYSQATKSYIFGKDSSIITNEKYECSDLEITDESNGIYTVSSSVTRTVEDIKTNYQITLEFKINSNYTYQKFNVKSLKAKNTSFYPDNTVHLIDKSSIIEEDEN